jgi:hypothetical protein
MGPLCVGLRRSDDELVLEVREDDGSGRDLTIRAGDEVAFELAGERECVGYRPPGGGQLIACPQHATAVASSQCQDCFAAAKILPCLRCNGERCHNPARRPACVQADNHATYLASFAPRMWKVGVARWERRRERLIEQGARAAIIIARDDGQNARRVEVQLRRIGIPDRYAPSEKLRALTLAGEPGELAAELEEMWARTRPRVLGNLLDRVEVVQLPRLPKLAAQPRILRPQPGLRLRGTVEALAGQSIIAAADNAESVALDLPSLVGFRIRQLAEGEAGAGQLALRLS